MPSINGLRVRRCNYSGTYNWNGSYIKVDFAWITKPLKLHTLEIWCWEVAFDGTETRIEYNAYKSRDYAALDTNSGNASYVVGSGNISPNKTYKIQVFVFAKDSSGNLMSDEYFEATKISYDRIYLLDFRNGGRGMAIGTEAIKDDCLDIDLQTNMLDLHFPNSYSIYGTTNNYGGTPAGQEYAVFTAMSTANNTTMGYGLYANRIGDSRIYGNDVWILSANAGGTVEKLVGYIPYYRAKPGSSHDSASKMNVCVTTTGYVTGGGKKVYFNIPLDRPILGSPTINVETTTGFILRQNGQYTHGSNVVSGSYTWKKPTTTKLNLIGDLGASYYKTYTNTGLSVEATFDNNTNVTNNSPIGIDFVGEIYFT